jgi:hypothetical protein
MRALFASAGRLCGLRGAGRLLAGAAGIAVLGGSAAAAQADSQTPQLTSTTVLSANGTAYVPVNLGQPLTVPFGETPQITVSNPSQFVAVVLVQVESGPPTGPVLEVVAMPDGQSTEYVYDAAGEDAAGDPFFSRPVLPAGSYRLYVIATGPEQIVLQLPALAGTQSLSAAIPAVSYSVVSSSPGAAGTAVAPVISVSGEFALPHRWGLLINDQWATVEDGADGFSGACYYGASTLSDATEPAPWIVCPGGVSGQANQAGVSPGTETAVGGGDAVGLQPGTFGMKAAEGALGVVENADVRLIWLDWG